MAGAVGIGGRRSGFGFGFMVGDFGCTFGFDGSWRVDII